MSTDFNFEDYDSIEINHIKSGLEKMLSQHKDKPVYAALLLSWLQQIQEAEEATTEMSLKRTFFSATGAQLDIVGYLLNLDRDGRTDSELRRAILAAIAVKSGDSTADSVQRITRLVTGSPIAKVYEHVNCASFAVASSGVYTPSDVEDVIETLAPAAVNSWYYEMGQSMKWRGSDTLRVYNRWKDEGRLLLGEQSLIVDDADDFVLFNNGKNVNRANEVAMFHERPKSVRGRKYLAVTNPDAKDSITLSKDTYFTENTEEDYSGVMCETYYQLGDYKQ